MRKVTGFGKNLRDNEGSEVAQAVLTFPSYFKDAQHQMTAAAGTMAALK
jgi:molecular chaperone DnaK (HSP70)